MAGSYTFMAGDPICIDAHAGRYQEMYTRLNGYSMPDILAMVETLWKSLAAISLRTQDEWQSHAAAIDRAPIGRDRMKLAVAAVRLAGQVTSIGFQKQHDAALSTLPNDQRQDVLQYLAKREPARGLIADLLHQATQTGNYSGIDVDSATKQMRGPTDLLGGLTVGFSRWLEVKHDGLIVGAAGLPPKAAPVSMGLLRVKHRGVDRRLLVFRQGWAVRPPAGAVIVLYIEVWWRAHDDLEWSVLESHAGHAAAGNTLSYGLLMRPAVGDSVLVEIAKREMIAAAAQTAAAGLLNRNWSPGNPGGGGAGGPPRRIVVTEQVIRDAMKGAPLKSQQKGGVSIPRVQEYVDKLQAGEEPPPIRTDGGIIVDGNHRYVAGRIVGKDPPIQPWQGGRPSQVVPWEDMKIDPAAW